MGKGLEQLRMQIFKFGVSSAISRGIGRWKKQADLLRIFMGPPYRC